MPKKWINRAYKDHVKHCSGHKVIFGVEFEAKPMPKNKFVALAEAIEKTYKEGGIVAKETAR